MLDVLSSMNPNHEVFNKNYVPKEDLFSENKKSYTERHIKAVCPVLRKVDFSLLNPNTITRIAKMKGIDERGRFRMAYREEDKEGEQIVE